MNPDLKQKLDSSNKMVAGDRFYAEREFELVGPKQGPQRIELMETGRPFRLRTAR